VACYVDASLTMRLSRVANRSGSEARPVWRVICPAPTSLDN